MKSPRRSEVTLIRIRSTRKTREVFSVVKILFILALVIAGIAGLQIAVCKASHPKRSIVKCLLPRLP